MQRPEPSAPCQHGHPLPVKRHLRHAVRVCPTCRYVCVLDFTQVIVPGSARVSNINRWAWVPTVMQGGTVPGTNQLFGH